MATRCLGVVPKLISAWHSVSPRSAVPSNCACAALWNRPELTEVQRMAETTLA